MSFNPKQVGKVVSIANITTVGANTLTFSAPVENSRAVVFNQTTAGSIPSFPNPTDTSVIFEFAVMNTGSVAVGLGNVTGLTSLAAGAVGNVAWNGTSYVNAGGGKSLATIDLAATGTTTLVANSSYHLTSWATNAILTLPTGGTDGDVIQIIDGTTARFPNLIGNVTTAAAFGITWGENTGSGGTTLTIPVGSLNAVNNFIYDATVQAWVSDLLIGNRAAYIANSTSGGVIGSAANTVDLPDVIIAIGQTTANVNFTLPNPTLTAIPRRVTVLNSGTVTFAVNGVTIAVGGAYEFFWSPPTSAWYGIGAASGVSGAANWFSSQVPAGTNVSITTSTNNPTVVAPVAARVPIISNSNATVAGTISSSSANNQVIISSAGVYQVIWQAMSNTPSGSGQDTYFQIVKNGTTVLGTSIEVDDGASANYANSSINWVGPLAANDVLDVRVAASTNGALNVFGGSFTVAQVSGTVAVPIGVKVTQLLANVPGTSVAGSASPGSQVAAWTAPYTASGGTVEVQASFDVIGTAGGILTAYLWRNGAVIATDTQAVVQGTGSGSTFQNMNLISAVIPNETGTNTYAISLGPNASLNSNGYCNMVVREYGAGVLASNTATFTGASSSTAGALGTVPAPAAGQQDNYLYGDGTWGGQNRLPFVSLSNFTASGLIGTAAATVDIYALAAVLQTTSGLTLSLPTPTNSARASRFVLFNSGTASFVTTGGVLVSQGTSVEFIWNVTTSAWVVDNKTFNVGNEFFQTLANQTANGVLTSAQNMEQYGVLLLPQTTAGLTMTLPAVSVAANGTVKFLTIINTGTASITVAGATISAGGAVQYYTNGLVWTALPTNSGLVGATSSTAGTGGTVPAPASGQQDFTLFGDGTWGGQDRLSYLFLAGLSASGNIGTAAATVDTYAFVEIQQSTTGLTLTLPNPTVTTRASRFILRNAGTASFVTSSGILMSPASSCEFEWSPNILAWRAVGTTFDVGNEFFQTLANQTANGVLTSAQNMEQYGVLLLPQTTAGLTMTLPAVSVAATGTVKFTEIINTGSAAITVAGVSIAAGGSQIYYTNGTAWVAVVNQSALPQVLVLNNNVTSGALGGITFSLTITDPLTLTTSVAMYGTVSATIVQFAAGSGWDYWNTGTSGTTDVITRGQSWSGNTSGKIGISSASYSFTANGTLSTAAAGGTTYTVEASGSGTNVCVVITRVQ